MTKTQKRRVISIIGKDATIDGKYVGAPRSGDACVIGGLALAAGVSRSRLLRVNSKEIGNLPWLQARLYAAFGLKPQALCSLQHINDNYDAHVEGKAMATKNRRVDLIRYVRSIR